MSNKRRQARILAMQALCQWEVHSDESVEALEAFLAAHQPEGSSGAVSRYASELVRAFWTQSTQVDERLSSASKAWSLSRMSVVDRNVMRVAVVELSGKKVPFKVALNEAIEIGRLFGGGDSPGFINAVLDTVLKTLKSPASK